MGIESLIGLIQKSIYQYMPPSIEREIVLDESARLIRLGARFSEMPDNGCAARLDKDTWALYATGRDLEDGRSYEYVKQNNT